MTRRAILVAGRNNVGPLDHQDDRTLMRACSVAHTFGNDEALPGRKFDYAIFEIDQEPPIQYEKEFVDLVVFMPVILTLHHSHPDNRIVHLAKRLIVPFVGTSISELLHIDHLKRSVQNVEVSLVWEFFPALSRIHAANLTTEHTEVAEKKTFSPKARKP